jgi:hypothetical protein
MPFDPNTGIWQTGGDRPWAMPSTSSGDVLNAFQSYSEYQRRREAQVLETMLKLRESGEAAYDVSQTPEGGGAMQTLGIQPESIEGMWQDTPESRFRAGISALDPETMTEEEIARLGLSTGFMNPKDYFLSQSRAVGARAREDAVTATEQKSFNQAARDAWKRSIDISDTEEAAAERFKAEMKFLYPGLPDERLDLALSNVKGVFGGKQGAQTAKAWSEAELARTKGSVLLQKLPAQLTLMNARAALDQANIGLKGVQQEIEEAKRDGTLPATQAQILQALESAERTAVEAAKIIPLTAAQKEGTPALIKEVQERAADLKKRLAAPAPPQEKSAGVEKPVEGAMPKGALGKSSMPNGTRKFKGDRAVIVRGGYWYYE